jgi:AcrR family transcriptional regulator
MPGSTRAYRRLHVDQRRQQLLDVGSRMFSAHSFEEISMQDIAAAAGVSKPLLYHYYPSKIDLFKAAVADKAAELQALITPSGQGEPLDELRRILDAYMAWIAANAKTWSKLMESAVSLPEARELIETFRRDTIDMTLEGLTGNRPARPALRIAIKGWLAYVDATLLDWVQTREPSSEQLRDMLLAMFAASLVAAREVDPESRLPT